MAPPLAGLILLLASAPAWAAPCPLRVEDPYRIGTEVNLDSPACVQAQAFLPVIEAVRKAADLPMPLVVIRIDPAINASYGRGQVTLYTAFLEAGYPDQVKRFIVAHEIGHGVQERRPEGAEKRRLRAAYLANRSTENEEALLAYSRRYEAQADSIAIELLARTPYAPGTARAGAEGFFRCGVTNEDLEPSVNTHPADARRVVNASLGAGFFSGRGENLGVGDGRGFDGIARLTTPGPDVTVSPYRPTRFAPASRIEDFRSDGAFQPGRLAYARFGRPGAVPTPAGGAVPFIDPMERLLTDGYIQAVNRLAAGPGVGYQVARACGSPEAAQAAEEFGPASWARRFTLAASQRHR